MSKMSPMMQQYLDIKSMHKDHVLFFRLGDFYEMFFDDALNISKELELTLTGRDCGLPERAPMCGIPYHSSSVYIKRLIEKGYKVAICEQTEEPSQAKGIVKREVVRLVTPGTIIEDEMLKEGVNNYIASVYYEKKAFSVCFADISTGEVYFTEQVSGVGYLDVINEISKFLPSEIIHNKKLLENKEIKAYLDTKLNATLTLIDDVNINNSENVKVITTHFGVDDVSMLNIAEDSLSIFSLGHLLSYLNYTQHDGAKRISNINRYSENQYMNIDFSARKNLELTQTIRSGEKKGTLLWVLDKTKTSMGKRYLKNAVEQPLMNIAEITKRQNAIGELISNSITMSEIIENLASIYDLDRLMTRVIYGTATPKDLKALQYTLENLPRVKELTSEFKKEYLKDIHTSIDELNDVKKLVENSINDDLPATQKDGGYIKKGFNSQLDEYRDICNNAKEYIERIENDEREKTGIKPLKIKYNRVFGYYIEITNSYLSQVPDEYIRKQTLTNCERYITQELKEIETKVLVASEKIVSLESEILTEIKKYIATKIDLIQSTSNAIAKLDFIASLAYVANQNNYSCPQVLTDGKIEIVGGRHPVVEQMLNGTPFVPNNTNLDNNDRIWLITGPNMAGKSTYMRQVAVITIMAQIGSYVPATSANISVVDKVFTRVGASDDLAAGESTFMVEMTEMANILKFATKQSLVILDEIGRGTSTFDGMSIAKAVIEYIALNKSLRCKTLFATHYHELTAMEHETSGIVNYNIAVIKRDDDITFLRKIVKGAADDSFGIEVAKLAGVPQKVITRAKEILLELESQTTQVINVKPEKEPTNQMTFNSYISEVEEKIKHTQLETISPLEALNLLYELKKMLK